MSKHKGVVFSILVSVVAFVIFTISDLISITVTPGTLIENLFTCIFFFIIIYLCYNKGYITGFEDASRKKFDSYLEGFDAGYNFVITHLDEIDLDD